MKKLEKITDLIPDKFNANDGSVRGEAAIGDSFARYGAGRSVLADKNGRLIAGNKSTEKFYETIGEDIIVVPTDGTKLVVVQRTDLDLETDAAARELAHADNRTNQLSYTPDVNQIDADITGGADLDWLFRADELDDMRLIAPPPDDGGDMPMIDYDRLPRQIGGEFELTIVFDSEEELREGRRTLQDLGYYTKN